jgi:hypothetical protein
MNCGGVGNDPIGVNGDETQKSDLRGGQIATHLASLFLLLPLLSNPSLHGGQPLPGRVSSNNGRLCWNLFAR